MKKMVLFLLLLTSLLLSNDSEKDFLQFIEFVSLQNNINIYVDADLKDKKIGVYVPDKISNKDLFFLLNKTVNDLGYVLNKKGYTYFLQKKEKKKDDKIFNHIYNLKFDSSLVCISLLDSLALKYKYLESVNSFLIISTHEQFLEVKNLLDKIDLKQNQVILRFMIFEFNDKDINEIGAKLGYRSDSNDFIGIFNTALIPTASDTLAISTKSFLMSFNLLQETNLIKVKQFPYILAKNNLAFDFNAVDNIPYLVATTTTDSTNVSQQNTVNYKDIGLKISGKPLIYNDYISLDLNLVVEDIVNQDSNMPQTFKRSIHTYTDIKFDNVLLLSGLKRLKHTTNTYSIPFLSNIPYLGEIFKYDNDYDESLNIVIAIQAIKKTDENSVEYIENEFYLNLDDDSYSKNGLNIE